MDGQPPASPRRASLNWWTQQVVAACPAAIPRQGWCRSDRDAFHDVPRHRPSPPVVEPRGPWGRMAGQVLHLLQRRVLLQQVGDRRHSERMWRELPRQPRRLRPTFRHPADVDPALRLGCQPFRSPEGRAAPAEAPASEHRKRPRRPDFLDALPQLRLVARPGGGSGLRQGKRNARKKGETNGPEESHLHSFPGGKPCGASGRENDRAKGIGRESRVAEDRGLGLAMQELTGQKVGPGPAWVRRPRPETRVRRISRPRAVPSRAHQSIRSLSGADGCSSSRRRLASRMFSIAEASRSSGESAWGGDDPVPPGPPAPRRLEDGRSGWSPPSPGCSP